MLDYDGLGQVKTICGSSAAARMGRALQHLKYYIICCISHYFELGWVNTISGQSYAARMG